MPAFVGETQMHIVFRMNANDHDPKLIVISCSSGRSPRLSIQSILKTSSTRAPGGMSHSLRAEQKGEMR